LRNKSLFATLSAGIPQYLADAAANLSHVITGELRESLEFAALYHFIDEATWPYALVESAPWLLSARYVGVKLGNWAN